jgi:hypothetical protein
MRLRACTYLGGVMRDCSGVASRLNEGDVVTVLLALSFWRGQRCSMYPVPVSSDRSIHFYTSLQVIT